MFGKSFIQNIDTNLKSLIPSNNSSDDPSAASPPSIATANTTSNDLLLKNSNLEYSLDSNPTVSNITTPISSITSINRHSDDFRQSSEESTNLSNTTIPENEIILSDNDSRINVANLKKTADASVPTPLTPLPESPPIYNSTSPQDNLPSYNDLLNAKCIDHLKYNLFFQSNKELNHRIQANLNETVPEYSSDLYKLGIALIKFEKNTPLLEVVNNNELTSQINSLSKNPWKLVIIELNSTMLNIYNLNILDQKVFNIKEIRSSQGMVQEIQTDKKLYYSNSEDNNFKYDKDFIHFKNCKDIFKVFDTLDSGVIPVSNKEYPQNCSYFYRYHGIPETQNLKDKLGFSKSNIFKNLNKSSSSTDMSLYSFSNMSHSSFGSGSGISNSNSEMVINDLNVYAIIKRILRRPKKFLNSNNLLTSLTLQHGKIGLANDTLLVKNELIQVSQNFGTSFLTCTKNPNNLLRVRLENYQFILNFKYVNDLISWYNSLTFSIDLSLDLSLRNLPTFNNIPSRRRRRRRRRRRKNANRRNRHRTLSITGVTSSLSSSNNTITNEASRRGSQPDQTFRRRLSSGASSIIRRRAFSTASSTSVNSAVSNMDHSISTAATSTAAHNNSNTSTSSSSASTLKMKTASPIMSFFLSEFESSTGNPNNGSSGFRSRSIRTSSNASLSNPFAVSTTSSFFNLNKQQTIQSLRKKKSSGSIFNTLSLSISNKDNSSNNTDGNASESKNNNTIISDISATCAVSSSTTGASTNNPIKPVSPTAIGTTDVKKGKKLLSPGTSKTSKKAVKAGTKLVENKRDRSASLNSTFTIDSADCVISSTSSSNNAVSKNNEVTSNDKSKTTNSKQSNRASSSNRSSDEYMTIFDNTDNSTFNININKIINFDNDRSDTVNQKNIEDSTSKKPLLINENNNGGCCLKNSEGNQADNLKDQNTYEREEQVFVEGGEGVDEIYEEEEDVYEDDEDGVYEDDEYEYDEDDDEYDEDEDPLSPTRSANITNDSNNATVIPLIDPMIDSNTSRHKNNFHYLSHRIYEKLNENDATRPTLKKVVKDCLKSMSVMKKDDPWTNIKLVFKESNVQSNKKRPNSPVSSYSFSSSTSSLPLKSFRGGFKSLKFGSNNCNSNTSLVETPKQNNKCVSSLGYFMISNQNLFHWDYTLKQPESNDNNDINNDSNEIIEMIYAC